MNTEQWELHFTSAEIKALKVAIRSTVLQSEGRGSEARLPTDGEIEILERVYNRMVTTDRPRGIRRLRSR